MLAQQDIQAALDALPGAALLGLAAMVIVGLVMWLTGALLVRVACVISGIALGGTLGWLVGVYFKDQGAYVLPLAIGGAILGGLLAGLLFRLWIAGAGALLLGLVVPAVSLAWQGSAPTTKDVDTDKLGQSVKDSAKQAAANQLKPTNQVTPANEANEAKPGTSLPFGLLDLGALTDQSHTNTQGKAKAKAKPTSPPRAHAERSARAEGGGPSQTGNAASLSSTESSPNAASNNRANPESSESSEASEAQADDAASSGLLVRLWDSLTHLLVTLKGHLADDAWAWWGSLDAAGHQIVYLGVAIGAGIGLLLGLVAPWFSAALQSSMIGSVMVYAGTVGLLRRTAGEHLAIVPASPRGVILLVGLITALGTFLQWMAYRKKSDK